MDISEKLKQIVASQLRIDVQSIDSNTDVMEDLGADSLDVVEILMVIEEQFGVTIPDEDITSLRSLADLQTYIENNM